MGLFCLAFLFSLGKNQFRLYCILVFNSLFLEEYSVELLNKMKNIFSKLQNVWCVKNVDL